MHLGTTLELSASNYSETGDRLEPDTVLWQVHHRNIARVDKRGRVTAVAVGSTWIVASDRVRRDSIRLISTVHLLSVHASTDATCGGTYRGTVVCWGWNEVGMLGDSTFVDSRVPVMVGDGRPLGALTAAGGITCGLAGELWCWGYNGSGQLGDGTNTSRGTPIRVVAGQTLLALFLGSGATPCALTEAAEMWCWGSNVYGQLLNGTFIASRRPIRLATTMPLVAAASGNGHMCGLDADSLAWCWGRNELGQTGTGQTAPVPAPAPVSGHHEFRLLVSGSEHACGLTAAGDVWCWGSNSFGQLGADAPFDHSTVPVRVSGMPRADTLVSTRDHNCILAAGEAWCWGSGLYGQLGATLFVSRSPVPQPVAGGVRFRTISAGTTHTCGISDDGYAWCWGRNRFGGLGNGGIGDASQPIRVAHQRQ